MEAVWWGCRWWHGRSFVGGGCGVIDCTRAGSAAFEHLSFGCGPKTFGDSGGSFEDAVAVAAAAAAAVVADCKPAVGFVAAGFVVDGDVLLPFA